MSETHTTRATGPLSGVKVVDLTRFLAGPICTMILADMGAETIKVEQPVKSGTGRGSTAPTNTVPRIHERNKKSITLNVNTEKGKDILRQLVQWADVLVESFRPGYMERIGFGYPALKEMNPRIIMTSISGYGQNGPHAHRPAFDTIGQAIGGMMAVTGPADSPPMASGAAVTDISTGVFGALGTTLALYQQRATGLGQHVEATLVESIVFLMGLNISNYLAGQPVEKGGMFSPKRTPGAGTFLTKDERYIVIMAHVDNHWPIIAKLMGREDLARDPRYTTRSERSRRAQEIESLLQQWVSGYTLEEVETILDEAGISFGRVQNVTDLFTDPQLRFRGWFEDMSYDGGTISVARPYPVLSDTPGSVVTPGLGEPGQHNEEIYCGLLGLSKPEIEALEREAVI